MTILIPWWKRSVPDVTVELEETRAQRVKNDELTHAAARAARTSAPKARRISLRAAHNGFGSEMELVVAPRRAS